MTYPGFLRFLSLFFSLFLWTGSALLWAQKGLNPAKELRQYNFNSWDTDKGLPTNGTLSIFQSSKGYIWTATYGGLVRFNGIGFIGFTSANTPEIVSNTFSDVKEDKKGTLWASTSGGGIVSLDKDGLFKTYTTEHGLPSNVVDGIAIDQKGVVWAASVAGLSYLGSNLTFTQEGLPQELKTLKIQRVYADPDDNIWVATSTKGLFKLTGKTITAQYNTGNGLVSNFVHTTFEAQNGDVWVGTDKGLCRIRQGQVSLCSLIDSLADKNVNAIFEDIDGTLWIGTFRGLARLKGQLIEQFPASHPLAEARIQEIMQDREGNLWISTYRNGIFKISDGIFTNYGRHESNSDYVVHTVIEIDNNNFLLVHEKGITLLDRRKNQLTEMNLGKGLITGAIKSVMRDSKQNLWICTYDGLFRCDKEGKISKFTTKEGLPANYTRVAYEDRQGNIWIGSQAGITLFSETNMVTYTKADGLGDTVILSVFQDSRNVFWLSTRNGVTRMENVGGKYKFTKYDSKNGLAGDVNFKIYEDAQGVLWIGSSRGITHYKNGKFTRITSQDGLYSDAVFQILEDKLGNFWITTNVGNVALFKVAKKDLVAFVEGKIKAFSCVGFNRADGMRASESTANSTGIMASDGSLWFPTLRGAEVINPAHLQINRQEPPVVIEEFIADHMDVNSQNNRELSPGQQRIEIHYAGLSYVAPQNVKYKYKLEGYDKDWQDVGSRNQAFYTNLPPGHYTFRVIACNNDGVWNTKGASLQFYLAPFFYQTRWFIGLITLMLVASGIGAYQWRVKSLHRDKQRLEKMVMQRTEEIRRQNDEILQINNELAQQKEAILQQHNNIEMQKGELEAAYEMIQNKNKHITDSIRYARTIQQATLPHVQHLQETIGEHFVIYRPKDIVSGDFYWSTHIAEENGAPEKVFVAVVDCTGHGVPGAFMSMIGNLLLSEIVTQEHIYDPAQIFEVLDQRIQLALQQKEQSNSDGMDICLCLLEKINPDTTRVTFAGAKRPLYYFNHQTAEMQVLKGDSHSIGGRQRKRAFTSHQVMLPKGAAIYLTTDGFSDQNNPEKEKFGYARLVKALSNNAHLSMSVQQHVFEETLDDFMREADQRDDITVMGIRI